MRRACVPYPIVIDDIHYSSMFQASIDTGISYKTIWLKISEKNGEPTTTRGFKICSEEWWLEHRDEWDEYMNPTQEE